MKKFYILIILGFLSLIVSGCDNQSQSIEVQVVPSASNTQTASAPTAANPEKKPIATQSPINTSQAVTPTTTKQTIQIPDKYLMNIAFAQQAPFGNWDALHEETCEEASMIMADKYLKQQSLSEQIMEDELQKLVKWENERGYKVDLTAQETVDVLKNYFGISAHLSRNVTVDQIKYELSQGKPIIIPAAGRVLGNPNFKAPGPIYHMLVIKGYNGREFITNDPGTRKGNGYVYSYNVLLNAIHDWNPNLLIDDKMSDADMLKGAKVMVVVDNL